MLPCIVNVPLQPARVPRSPHLDRAQRPILACPACPELRAERQQTATIPSLMLVVRRVLARHSPLITRHSLLLSHNVFFLTHLRTLAPATPFFSHTSQKHPGVAWAHSNHRPLCNLRTLNVASSAHTPYRWAIALGSPRCHNRVSGELPAGRVLCVPCFTEDYPPGQETFLRSVVSNKLSGRGLGVFFPIRSAKRPDAGKKFLGRPLWPRPAWASSPSSALCWKTG